MQWDDGDGWLTCREGGHVLFRDSHDHFGNGLCRLLGLDEAAARRLVELSGSVARLPEDELVAALRHAAEAVFGTAPEGGNVLGGFSRYGHRADWLVAPRIAESGEVAVVGNRAAEIAWLVDRSGAPLSAPAVAYDEAYFEGEIAGLGYGDYRMQQGWRIEKAHRFLRRMRLVAELGGAPLPERPRLLDIGSGYGFFRKAAEDTGWRHDGWEISRYAAAIGRGLFGFDTAVGEIEALAAENADGYNAVTLWDVIEHVPDPLATLRLVHGLTTPGGLVFLRTPNLMAIEAEAFGWRYHSLKLEHLFTFGPQSLVWLLEGAGFEIVHLATDSHLLGGLLGSRQAGFAARLRGSDFFACARKPLETSS